MSKIKKERYTDLRFAIALNADFNESDIANAITKLFPNFETITPAAFRESRNMLVLDENDLYNPQKIQDEDGWIYYKYEISVFPFGDIETTPEYQRNLARLLISKFREIGFLADIVCDDGFWEAL